MQSFKTFRKAHVAPADNRRGAVLVFLVAGIVMLLAMTMISVDVASMQLARTELRAASDAAAKAGAEALLRTQNSTKAVDAALSMAELNHVAGKPFKLAENDIVIGTSSQQLDGSWTFSKGGSRPNAVRVNSAMDSGSASGPVNLAFGKIFNAGTFTPSKTSTASAVQQEVCLVLDRSASMSFNLQGIDWVYPPKGAYEKPPQSGSRWESLSKAVDVYMKELDKTPIPPRVALVTWGSDMTKTKLPVADLTGVILDPTMLAPLPYVESIVEVSLDLDRKDIKKIMKHRGSYPIYGGTNMASGIDEGIDVLTGGGVKPYAARTMVLMSDGMWNQGENPVYAAQRAKAKGIVIHVVTFLPGAASVDSEQVAKTTGGVYIHANTEAELVSAFERIARTLPVVLTD